MAKKKGSRKPIFDATIGMDIDLMRFEEGMRKKILSLLKQTAESIEIEIYKARLDEMTPWQDERIKTLLSKINAVLDRDYTDIGIRMNQEFAELAGVTAKGTQKVFNAKVGASIFGEVALTPEKLAAIIKNTAIDGRPMAEWWGKASAAAKARFAPFMDEIKTTLAISEVKSEAVGKIMRRIRGTRTEPGIMNLSKREAEAWVRTSTMQVANTAGNDTYAANADVLIGIQWVSFLDNRTTQICRDLDGRQFTLDGQPLDGGKPKPPGPPAHWNCRSTAVPLTRSYAELAEKGGPLNKRQRGSLINMALDQKEEYAKQGESFVKYQEWLETLPEEQQIDYLGEPRFRMWKKGKLATSDLLHQMRRSLTLNQLAEKWGWTHAEVQAYREIANAAALATKKEFLQAFEKGENEGLRKFMRKKVESTPEAFWSLVKDTRQKWIQDATKAKQFKMLVEKAQGARSLSEFIGKMGKQADAVMVDAGYTRTEFYKAVKGRKR